MNLVVFYFGILQNQRNILNIKFLLCDATVDRSLVSSTRRPTPPFQPFSSLPPLIDELVAGIKTDTKSPLISPIYGKKINFSDKPPPPSYSPTINLSIHPSLSNLPTTITENPIFYLFILWPRTFFNFSIAL